VKPSSGFVFQCRIVFKQGVFQKIMLHILPATVQIAGLDTVFLVHMSQLPVRKERG